MSCSIDILVLLILLIAARLGQYQSTDVSISRSVAAQRHLLEISVTPTSTYSRTDRATEQNSSLTDSGQGGYTKDDDKDDATVLENSPQHEEGDQISETDDYEGIAGRKIDHEDEVLSTLGESNGNEDEDSVSSTGSAPVKVFFVVCFLAIACVIASAGGTAGKRALQFSTVEPVVAEREQDVDETASLMA